jgi:hypothetical protein
MQIDRLKKELAASKEKNAEQKRIKKNLMSNDDEEQENSENYQSGEERDELHSSSSESDSIVPEVQAEQVESSSSNGIRREFERDYGKCVILINNILTYKPALLGFRTKEEVICIYEITARALEDTTTKDKKRVRQSHKQQKVDLFTQLCLTLFWHHQYPVMSLLEVMTGLDRFYLNKIFVRVLTALSDEFSHIVHWPSDEEFEQWTQHFHALPKLADQVGVIVCCVDGTEIRMKRSSKVAYSVKKKQAAMNVLIITLMNGVMVYVSKPSKIMQDQALWNELELRNLFVGKPWGIIGDGGFAFNPMNLNGPAINGYTPFRRPRHGELTREEKDYNKQLTQLRSVIENTNAQLKQWRILGTTYRHLTALSGEKLSLELVMKVCTKGPTTKKVRNASTARNRK